MTRQQILAATIRESAVLFKRYLVGFDDSNYLRGLPTLPNHVGWCLGHTAVVMQRVAGRIDRLPISLHEFVEGVEGDEQRIAANLVAFGSTPSTSTGKYPSFLRCVEIFDSSVARFAVTLESASDHQLDAPVQWGQSPVPAWTLAARMAFHNGVHCGQITDIRKSLRLKSIFA